MRLIEIGLGLLLAAAVVAIVADSTTTPSQHGLFKTVPGGFAADGSEPASVVDGSTAEPNATTEEPLTTTEEFVPAPKLLASATIEIELLVDEPLFQVEFRSSQQALYRFCLEVTHQLGGLFATVSINIKLRAVEVWRRPVSKQSKIALTTLLRYRQMRQLAGPTASDFTVLLVSVPFQHSVVGNSILRGLCTSAYSGTIVSTDGFPANATSWVENLADTIAHELGHGLGLGHDDADVVGSDTIMAAVASTSPRLRLREWSAPNRDHFLKQRAQLLRNYPCLTTVAAAAAVHKPTQDFASCGNGIIDNGEECDCGHPFGARCLGREGTCCEPGSCLLWSGAACGVNSECCDLTTCQFRTNRTLCRPVAHPECDVPEYCTGQSGHCPPDTVRNTLSPCAYTDESFTAYSGSIVAARCIRGTCRTHTDQCRRLWGPMMRSASLACYDHNSNGTYANNCGRIEAEEKRALKQGRTARRRTKTIETLANMTYPYRYRACPNEHTRCGTVQCQQVHARTQLPPQPLVGTIVRTQSKYTRQDTIVVRCLAASIDVGARDLDNPALAPDGATCGPDRVCYRQRCYDVETLRRILEPVKPTPRTTKAPTTTTMMQIVTTTTTTSTTRTTVVVTTPKLLPTTWADAKSPTLPPTVAPSTGSSIAGQRSHISGQPKIIWERHNSTLTAPTTSVATIIITTILVLLILVLVSGTVLCILSAKANSAERRQSDAWTSVPPTDRLAPPEYDQAIGKVTWTM